MAETDNGLDRPVDGRDNKGRFLPGNKFGVGRPARQRELEYLRKLCEACPLETWQMICEKAVEDALAGDYRARQWLSAYLLGDPQQARTIEIPGIEGLTDLATGIVRLVTSGLLPVTMAQQLAKLIEAIQASKAAEKGQQFIIVDRIGDPEQPMLGATGVTGVTGVTKREKKAKARPSGKKRPVVASQQDEVARQGDDDDKGALIIL